MMDALHCDDDKKVRSIEDFLASTLVEVEELDHRIHVLQDHIRSRITALNLLQRPAFRELIDSAEKLIAESPNESPDALHRRLEDLIARR